LEIQISISADFREHRREFAIFVFRSFNTREKIVDDVLEQGDIVFEEFRDVDISQRSEK